MVSIDDERAQASLISAICAGNGPAVAGLATALVKNGRTVLVKRACMQCANRCQLQHAKALVGFFASSRRDLEALADVVATVMAGVRAGCEVVPMKESCRDVVDALMRDGCTEHVDNLGALPARISPAWSGLIAVVREAIKTKVVQTPLVHNANLVLAFKGKDLNMLPAYEDSAEDLKLCIVWAFVRDAEQAAAPPHKREEYAPLQAACSNLTKTVRCDLPARTCPSFTCVLDEPQSLAG